MPALRLAARRYRQALNPFPNTKLVRHKYCDTVQLAATAAGGIQYYQFRANSTFDPDYTGGGHQPMFRDEMAAQYNYYTVLSSNITWKLAPSNDTEGKWMAFVDDETSFGTQKSLEESHYVRGPIRLGKRQDPLVLKSYYDAAKWNKTTRAGILADDQQKISNSGNGNSAVAKYFTLCRTVMGPTDTFDAINCFVTVYYTTLWREPVDHAAS